MTGLAEFCDRDTWQPSANRKLMFPVLAWVFGFFLTLLSIIILPVFLFSSDSVKDFWPVRILMICLILGVSTAVYGFKKLNSAGRH